MPRERAGYDSHPIAGAEFRWPWEIDQPAGFAALEVRNDSIGDTGGRSVAGHDQTSDAGTPARLPLGRDYLDEGIARKQQRPFFDPAAAVGDSVGSQPRSVDPVATALRQWSAKPARLFSSCAADQYGMEAPLRMQDARTRLAPSDGSLERPLSLTA
jgi:hypothetical protein